MGWARHASCAARRAYRRAHCFGEADIRVRRVPRPLRVSRLARCAAVRAPDRPRAVAVRASRADAIALSTPFVAAREMHAAHGRSRSIIVPASRFDATAPNTPLVATREIRTVHGPSRSAVAPIPSSKANARASHTQFITTRETHETRAARRRARPCRRIHDPHRAAPAARPSRPEHAARARRRASLPSPRRRCSC